MHRRSSPSAVVFDVGGVLLGWDPRTLYRKILPEEVMESFLAEVCTPAWNLEQDRGRPWDAGVAERIAIFPQHADLIRTFRDRWREMFTGPITGTIRILERLHGAGVPCYGLTNFSQETFPGIRAEFAFFNHFRGIVVSGEEKLIKPDPAIYRCLTDRYDLDPAELIFIDDMQPNVEAACALGWQGHHFVTPEALETDLRARGLPV